MDTEFIVEYIPLYAEAAKLTISIGLIGIALSLIVGLLVAIIQYFKIPVLKQIAAVYIELSRALLLLQDNGIITLKEGAGLEATINDIEENPKNIEILELEAAQLSRVKDEVAFVVLNGNYALQAGFSVAQDSIAYEKADSEAAKTYVNVIAVAEGKETSEAIQALVNVLTSDEIKQYINDTYDGAVIPFN